MKKILLLEESGMSNRFDKVEVSPPAGTSKIDYLERKVLKAINLYNHKLKITRIEYGDLNDLFPEVEASKYTGLIIEKQEIIEVEEEDYSRLGYTVREISDQWYAMKIVAYIFFSVPKEKGRNTLVAQSIFPEFIDYMDRFIASPSYTIANHPIYYINIINKEITARTVLKPLAGIIATGIYYVEAFPSTINSNDVPYNLKGFVEQYELGYNPLHSRFVSDYYEIDFALKELKIKTFPTRFLNMTGTNFQFKGSSEKFYWMEILPVFLMACKEGYNVDYSELEDFYDSNIGHFTSRNEKFPRFLKLLNYIKKLNFN